MKRRENHETSVSHPCLPLSPCYWLWDWRAVSFQVPLSRRHPPTSRPSMKRRLPAEAPEQPQIGGTCSCSHRAACSGIVRRAVFYRGIRWRHRELVTAQCYWFKGNQCGWAERWKPTDSRLVFDFDTKQLYTYLFYEPFEYENVALEARVENRGMNDNNISLICRYSEDEGWYEFNIANSGLYNILYGFYKSDGDINYACHCRWRLEQDQVWQGCEYLQDHLQ